MAIYNFGAFAEDPEKEEDQDLFEDVRKDKNIFIGDYLNSKIDEANKRYNYLICDYNDLLGAFKKIYKYWKEFDKITDKYNSEKEMYSTIVNVIANIINDDEYETDGIKINKIKKMINGTIIDNDNEEKELIIYGNEEMYEKYEELKKKYEKLKENYDKDIISTKNKLKYKWETRFKCANDKVEFLKKELENKNFKKECDEKDKEINEMKNILSDISNLAKKYDDLY